MEIKMKVDDLKKLVHEMAKKIGHLVSKGTEMESKEIESIIM